MKVQAQVQGEKQEFSMDGYLKSNLDLAKKVIKKDWDMIFVVDGYEGCGKSVLAMQMAKYCDPDFDLNRIAFTSMGFIKAITKAKPYQAVIYDEAYAGLSGRQVLSETNRTLVTMLTEIRQKNLFVFVVLPTIFELDRYVALWRSRALIHVYTGDNLERGRFSFYSVTKKKQLYMLGKKTYSYVVSPDFIGRFPNFYVIDEKEYRRRKLKSIKERKTMSLRRVKAQRDALLVILHDRQVPHQRIAALMEEKSGYRMSGMQIGRLISWQLGKKQKKTSLT